MRDLIFVSLEDWDQVWRRNQFLCAGWLQRFPGMQILFVGKSRDYSNSIRTANFESLKRPGFYQINEFPGLSVLNPQKLMPNSIRACRNWNASSLLRQVRFAADSLVLRNPILWINDHFAGHLAGKMGERGIVYDITDDWSKMPSVSVRERKRIIMEDRKLCQKADVVVVCSKALEKSRISCSRRVERVPNGVDAAHYRSCFEEASRRSESGKPNPNPVFGYLGTLHRDRLDVELVVALARKWPAGRVVLCGPDYLKPADKTALLAAPNVEVRPAVPYRDVPSVLSDFDVCIVPHHCNAFTDSLNPLKLWEYLACGKPIASTPVAGFADYPNLVYLGSGVDGFGAACSKALAEGGEVSGKRVREAEAQSWEARVDQLTEIFRQQGWMGGRSSRRRLVTDVSKTVKTDELMGEVCHG